jgi:hypothetical protein
MKKEYVRRLRLIMNTELSAKNKMEAIGTLAIPVQRYSSELLNDIEKKCKKLDEETSKMLTVHGQHHT